MEQTNHDTPAAAPEADVADIVSAFDGCSKDEIFEALRDATQAEREAGRFDETYMEGIYEKIAPMLNEHQRERMREVIRRLKE